MTRWGALGLLVAAGCMGSHYDLASQRESYTITSTDKEVAVGRKLAKRVAHDLPAVKDESLQRRVQTIGQRIVAVCDRRDIVYRFTVVQEDDANAFSLPGGYVFLNEGLIKKTAGDDELAGVIAHEVAHIVARHSVKHYEAGLGAQLVQLAALATRSGDAVAGASIAAQAAQLAYSRQDELDADRLAVKYLNTAGFDPKAMLTFLEKLHDVDRDKSRYLPRGVVRPQYAMTHPYVPERLRAVKEALFGAADYLDYLNAAQ